MTSRWKVHWTTAQDLIISFFRREIFVLRHSVELPLISVYQPHVSIWNLIIQHQKNCFRSYGFRTLRSDDSFLTLATTDARKPDNDEINLSSLHRAVLSSFYCANIKSRRNRFLTRLQSWDFKVDFNVSAGKVFVNSRCETTFSASSRCVWCKIAIAMQAEMNSWSAWRASGEGSQENRKFQS